MIQLTIDKLKQILLDPKAFWSELHQHEKGFQPAWKYFWVVMAPAVVLSYIMNLMIPFSGIVTINNMGTQPGAMALLVGHVVAYVVFPLAIFVLVGFYAVMLNFMGMMLHFKLSYDQTFQIVVYSSTPALFLGNFPFIDLVGLVWAVVLMILGIRTLGQTSIGVATTALLTPFVLFIGCIFTVLGVFLKVL